ncbi:MarR family winged helix-turn-helix transcriptional regulator [Actinomadura rayongensis]|uniref:MarR family transcriptional regulator n=1 Tax=Actinomadura rayongensis TaxID=1429076 RepID=A0A6I4WCG0_9ACTN|nr:MarR family transcriptional regulator [Actinomadura rayongensis]MXQ66793.1 MarR family transcriptional regulator [Actinomadura rayongensis]
MEPEEHGLVERWRSLLTCYNTVACHLDRLLQEKHGLTMSEFETLDRLAECHRDNQRMQDLAGEMYLSQSALSRTVGRLEKHGLVARSLCSSDRRGVYVCITPEGRARHEKARATHRAVLAEHLVEDLLPTR